jgi:hypothetical protein
LPDCWIGAGFVRNAVWDHRHGRPPRPPRGDIDVLWFGPEAAGSRDDRRLEDDLRAREPALDWSVKNQARMHLRNGDPPYASVGDAMRCWPETATAVAVRHSGGDACEILAPFGLSDLFDLLLRPTPRFTGPRRAAFLARVREKRWLNDYECLRMAAA